ncbi:hypothetical protein [uncultured Erythrobacter sp.]|uniref:hypothetical protein n=1 Tax=uncultured Erythrobacter sp. TaxID=263913 RepID=UPI002635A758|nr:hypothetical protein [uncultured Erythrobacter sp.]
MTTAEAILTDLLADGSDWWAGELQTVTGFYRAEFEELFSRATEEGFVPRSKDKQMLHQAANTLLGHPDPSTSAIEKHVGPDWEGLLEDFMCLMGQ